jgi:hypothetical protein
MQLRIEIGLRPNLHVGSNAGSTKSPVSSIPPPEMLRGFIGENDHQVVVAVGSGIAPGSGSKKVDPQWMVHLYQPADNFRQCGVDSRRGPEDLAASARHSSLSFCHMVNHKDTKAQRTHLSFVSL